MLIDASARGVRRLDLSFFRVHGCERWLVAGRAEPEMDHVRWHAGVTDERRMKLERKIGMRDDGMDREYVRPSPRVSGLAQRGSGVDRQLKIDHRTRGDLRHWWPIVERL